MAKKTKKLMTYDELKHQLKLLQAENKIAFLNSFYCPKTELRTIKFYLHGAMWQFECGEDESKVIDFYNKIKNKIGN